VVLNWELSPWQIICAMSISSSCALHSLVLPLRSLCHLLHLTSRLSRSLTQLLTFGKPVLVMLAVRPYVAFHYSRQVQLCHQAQSYRSASLALWESTLVVLILRLTLLEQSTSWIYSIQISVAPFPSSHLTTSATSSSFLTTIQTS